MRHQKWFLFGLVAVLALAGCAADPAANKPDAEVSEPRPETEPSTGGEKLTFTDDSTIRWIGSKITGSHEGGFKVFEGEVTFNEDPTASSVQVTIDTTSLWSDNDNLTTHLKSADFFDVEKYPTATFISTSIEAADGGYMVTGNLNLHGVERSIRFPAEITVGDGTAAVSASFSIKRFDFGIVYPGRKDDLIRDEVAITLDLRAGPA
jgi:polyisoprenoid-binding protein YceI